jgi:hypothetical protein
LQPGLSSGIFFRWRFLNLMDGLMQEELDAILQSSSSREPFPFHPPELFFVVFSS